MGVHNFEDLARHCGHKILQMKREIICPDCAEDTRQLYFCKM
jgi:hypothetical protein